MKNLHAKLPYRATKYLPVEEEQRIYEHAFMKGFRRGTREAEVRRKLFGYVLNELLLDIGRRKAMLYCLEATCDYLRRHPIQKKWIDFNVFHEVNKLF